MSLPQCLVAFVILISLFMGLSVAVAEETPKCAPLETLGERPLSKTTCFSGTFKSESLGGREIPISLIAPEGYLRSKPVPYAIFLHGRGGDQEQILEVGAVDALERARKATGRSFLIVAPAGGNHYWVNAAISGERWGDMVVRDLVSHIEKSFAVLKGPANRALFGISMGGHGTLQLALNNPSVFRTGLAISPVFRSPQDIWTPTNPNGQPEEDYDSFGEGESYRARSARSLCERVSPAPAPCLPFANFKLEIGDADPLLDQIPDTRAFIIELSRRHRGNVSISACVDEKICSEDAECSGHTYAFWRCQMPSHLSWLAKNLGR